ncbi:MAG: hypothetical protein HQL26_05805 [Candidatus Omnitrophica bacterium]|nr:hypothetical protein [Candidatus Omnitrophota bacterium]
MMNIENYGDVVNGGLAGEIKAVLAHAQKPLACLHQNPSDRAALNELIVCSYALTTMKTLSEQCDFEDLFAGLQSLLQQYEQLNKEVDTALLDIVEQCYVLLSDYHDIVAMDLDTVILQDRKRNLMMSIDMTYRYKVTE